jgi:hypothetical protein
MAPGGSTFNGRRLRPPASEASSSRSRTRTPDDGSSTFTPRSHRFNIDTPESEQSDRVRFLDDYYESNISDRPNNDDEEAHTNDQNNPPLKRGFNGVLDDESGERTRYLFSPWATRAWFSCSSCCRGRTKTVSSSHNRSNRRRQVTTTCWRGGYWWAILLLILVLIFILVVLSGALIYFNSSNKSNNANQNHKDTPTNNNTTTHKGEWIPLGNQIKSPTDKDGFGEVIALSGNGLRVIAGCRYADKYKGRASVFEYAEKVTTEHDTQEDGIAFEEHGSWKQVGGDILGVIEAEAFGRTLSISYDGTIVAVGAASYGHIHHGVVRIYQEKPIINDGDGGSSSDTETEWVQMGEDLVDGPVVRPSPSSAASKTDNKNKKDIGIDIGIDPNATSPTPTNSFFGSSVDLSNDGRKVAIASAEHAYVFECIDKIRVQSSGRLSYSEDEWILAGHVLGISDNNDEFSGVRSVSLSAMGDFVAVGGHGYKHRDAAMAQGQGLIQGHFQVFQLLANDKWTK